MRRIEWSVAALDDFEAAIGYTATDSPAAVSNASDRLFPAPERLAEIPAGRHGRVSGETFAPNTPSIGASAMPDRSVAVPPAIHARRDGGADECPAE